MHVTDPSSECIPMELLRFGGCASDGTANMTLCLLAEVLAVRYLLVTAAMHARARGFTQLLLALRLLAQFRRVGLPRPYILRGSASALKATSLQPYASTTTNRRRAVLRPRPLSFPVAPCCRRKSGGLYAVVQAREANHHSPQLQLHGTHGEQPDCGFGCKQDKAHHP